MTKSTDENSQLAHSIAQALGGEPSVRAYHDNDGSTTIDILTCADAPHDLVNCYATLGLSDAEVFDNDGNRLDFGIEIVAACEADAPQFAEVMSTCAFNIIKDRMPIYPGAVFPRVLDLYRGLSSTLSHAFFVEPFLWQDGVLSSRKMTTRTVAFLQMIPIADSEYEFLCRHGPHALERKFEEQQIDVFDVDRRPAV